MSITVLVPMNANDMETVLHALRMTRDRCAPQPSELRSDFNAAADRLDVLISHLRGPTDNQHLRG